MKRVYLLIVDTEAPEHKLPQLDLHVAREIHHATSLCETPAGGPQRAHLYVLDPDAQEVKYDPIAEL